MTLDEAHTIVTRLSNNTMLSKDAKEALAIVLNELNERNRTIEALKNDLIQK